MEVPPDKAGVDTGDADTAVDIEAVDAVEVVEPGLSLKVTSRSVTTHTITQDRILARPLSSLSIHCSPQSKCDTIITVMCGVHRAHWILVTSSFIFDSSSPVKLSPVTSYCILSPVLRSDSRFSVAGNILFSVYKNQNPKKM